MKARVKTTGYIVNVELSHYLDDVAWYITKSNASYSENELEFIDEPQNYWTRLEHQYAGMAMQGILSNANHALWDMENNVEVIAKSASAIAHALVDKCKKEK